MLTVLLSHAGRPPVPHDLWGAWNLDPRLVLGIGLTAWAYHRGRRGGRSADGERRARCFAAALAAVAVALLSPLDALSGALAAAHMVQHLLLLLVAAPLLALSAPSLVLLRGSPMALRRALGRGRRRLGLTRRHVGALGQPAAAWLLHVATVWFWHASVPYDAAVTHEMVHVAEHASFLATAWLFWRVVIGAPERHRVSPGFGVLLVFAMAMQSVFLSALLTFAQTPWYPAYATTTPAWGLDPLADQQLAGAIMWVPAGVVYLVVALILAVTWLHDAEREYVDSPITRVR